MAILRRKRLADGTFGPLEKVFDGETETEKIERLELERAEQDERVDFLEGALFELIMKVHE